MLDAAIEAVLQPGCFIPDGASWSFIEDLEAVARQLQEVVRTDPMRAVPAYETFIAGCHEKAEELDDSSGSLGMFVESLFSGWITARQGAGADRDDMASRLLAWIDDDPYGFCDRLEDAAVKVLDRDGLRALERQVLARVEPLDATPAASVDEAVRRKCSYAQRRYAEILRAVYLQQRAVAKYVELAERTGLTAADCEAIARLLQGKRQLEDALGWVERGIAVEKQARGGSSAGYKLDEMKRALLGKLGRGDEALASAWAKFQKSPHKYTYEELMRYVPKAERRAWHEKAMTATEAGKLSSAIELWLATGEQERLIDRLRRATDQELEDLSHFATEPAAKKLEKAEPAIVARLWRAQGMRIVSAKKSKYYDAALSNFERARDCYRRAGHDAQWQALVALLRQDHHRKVGFMAGFETLVAGQGPSEMPSFLDRARSRWRK